MSIIATNQTIQQAKTEKWYRADLSWKLHSAQRVIDQTYRNSANQLFVGNCSRQFGKTFWAVIKAVELALSKPNAQIRYGAAFQSDLMDFIIPAFEKVMEDCPEDIKGVFKTQGSKFVFPNGSIIKLCGLDKNPNGLRGNTLDLIIIDECGFVGNLDYIYKSVIIPATTHRPNAKIILISTPPSTPAHSFLDYAQKAELEGSYSVFTVFENPRVNAKGILRLMKETGCVLPADAETMHTLSNMVETKTLDFPESWKLSTTFRREYLCEFITDTDLQIIPEWDDKYVQEIEQDEYYGYYHKYVGMDLGVKDFTAAIFGYYDFKRAAVIIEDEFMMNGPKMNTAILVNTIKTAEKALWGEGPEQELPKDVPFRRISDNNNPLLVQDLSYLHSLPFIATSKDNLDAMVNELRIMVQNGQVIVSPRCKQLIGCLKFGVWNEKKDKFARSSTYGHFDHLAALIYLVRNLAKTTNPIPASHGHENHRSWMGHIDPHNRSKNSHTMAQVLGIKRKKLI